MFRLAWLVYLIILGGCGQNVAYSTAEVIENPTLQNQPQTDDQVAETPSSPEEISNQKISKTSQTDESSAISTTQDQAQQGCQAQSESRLTFRVTLDFEDLPDAQTCPWEQGDNLSRLNGFFRAHLRQTNNVALPEMKTLCSVSLIHDQQDMVFDDEIFLLMGDSLIFSSKDYTNRLAQREELPVFDWLALRDTSYRREENILPFCFAADQGSQCEVPSSENLGRFYLNFEPAAFASLVGKSIANANQDSFDLTLITTGDNDDSDCRHSPMQLQLSIEYLSEK